MRLMALPRAGRSASTAVANAQAVNMFLKQAIRERRIPFEVTARPQVRYAVMRIEEGEAHGE